jgi:hypothetical protein
LKPIAATIRASEESSQRYRPPRPDPALRPHGPRSIPHWYKAGRRVPDTVVVPTFIVDKTNVAAFAKNPYFHT